ncbi:MAG: long-chain fatty acid--CoA ligase, partial [Frankiales bacterium]|nr:long-chain fatty acid--CoA ligase [Frankiales bacterium]
VVGDQKPFIAALVTINEDAFPDWQSKNNKDSNATVADLADDDALRAAVQEAIDDANRAVSKAEAIKAFTILGDDWTVDSGHLTPSLKVKRNEVLKDYSAEVDAIYSSGKPD